MLKASGLIMLADSPVLKASYRLICVRKVSRTFACSTRLVYSICIIMPLSFRQSPAEICEVLVIEQFYWFFKTKMCHLTVFICLLFALTEQKIYNHTEQKRA
jgi:hypothetical protein